MIFLFPFGVIWIRSLQDICCYNPTRCFEHFPPGGLWKAHQMFSEPKNLQKLEVGKKVSPCIVPQRITTLPETKPASGNTWKWMVGIWLLTLPETNIAALAPENEWLEYDLRFLLGRFSRPIFRGKRCWLRFREGVHTHPGDSLISGWTAIVRGIGSNMIKMVVNLSSRWWFQRFFIFTPIWGRFPIWLIFFRWVETTN